MISFNVASLLGQIQGTHQEFDFDAPLDFNEADLKLTENVKGRMECLKLAAELNVQIHNLHTAVASLCARCLKPISFPVDVAFTEREFIFDKDAADIEVGEDVFYVNTSRNEIILDEMIRQEILLHFPPVPLCSQSCKGLCPTCGTNLNDSICSCN